MKEFPKFIIKVNEMSVFNSMLTQLITPKDSLAFIGCERSSPIGHITEQFWGTALCTASFYTRNDQNREETLK